VVTSAGNNNLGWLLVGRDNSQSDASENNDVSSDVRGESSNDVMVNLFKGYFAAPDKEEWKKNERRMRNATKSLTGRWWPSKLIGHQGKEWQDIQLVHKHKIWTFHKSSEWKLESPNEDKANKEDEDKGLQLNQALAAIDDDDKSVKWLLSFSEKYCDNIMNEMITIDSWLNGSYNFLIWFISIH